MIMSVSTLMIFSGAATPSSVVNLSMVALSRDGLGEQVFIAIAAEILGRIRQI
jgi:hypothetical protein